MGQPKRRQKRIAALHFQPGHGPVATIQQTDEGSSGGDNVKMVRVEMVLIPTGKESRENGRQEEREKRFDEK